MKFVLVSKCGQINIDDVRRKKIIDAFLQNKTCRKELHYFSGVQASSCVDCPNATIEDKFSKSGDKVVVCDMLILKDYDFIPSDWISVSLK